MKRQECPGTLLARARKYPLSAAETLALEAHLAGCECCHIMHTVMHDLDADATTDRHDGARIERLASFARQKTIDENRRRYRRGTSEERFGVRVFGVGAVEGSYRDIGQRGPRVFLLAAAVFLVVAGASGAILVQKVVKDQGAEPRIHVLDTELGRPVAREAQRAARAGFQPTAKDEIEQALAELEPANPNETPRSACRGNGCPGDAARSDSGFASDAAKLFKQANDARREGRATAAIGLYQDLQRRHARSPQAQLSHLSLGHLLLGGGQTNSALQQFNGALGSSRASSLQAEALYGKGLALGRLGRTSEEHSTWRALLRDFPSSPYASHAERRLGESD